jgi:hypothetical protein
VPAPIYDDEDELIARERQQKRRMLFMSLGVPALLFVLLVVLFVVYRPRNADAQKAKRDQRLAEVQRPAVPMIPSDTGDRLRQPPPQADISPPAQPVPEVLFPRQQGRTFQVGQPFIPSVPAEPGPMPQPKAPQRNSPVSEDRLTESDRAALEENINKLRTGKVGDRITAAAALARMGPKARSARRALCQGMLDGNGNVRTVAADALKIVDESIHGLAIAILLNSDYDAVRTAAKMKD